MPTDRMSAYHTLRQTGKELCGKLFGVIPRAVLVSTAQELGLWKGGVLVADAGDTDVLADRMIYDRRWDGKSCIEHFEAKNPGMRLSECEGSFIAAMKTGRFSLFVIRETHPGSFAVLSDRLAEIRSGQAQPLLELTDLGLSETGVPGMLLATRILFADGFNMTSGVSFPFTFDREGTIMKYLREKEFGYRKKRLDLPENYSLSFYRLHRRFGIDVRYEGDEEE
jgi:hypothetical protein